MLAKNYGIEIIQDYNQVDGFNRYPQDMMGEYLQSIEEGLDIEKYKNLFESVAALEPGEIKTKFSDIIFDIILNADVRSDYKYNEPSDIKEIKALRKPYIFEKNILDGETLRKKIHGAWMGRAVGCLLGKPFEGIRSDENHNVNFLSVELVSYFTSYNGSNHIAKR